MIEQGLQDMGAGRRPRPYTARLIRKHLDRIREGHATRGLHCGVGRNTNIVDCDGNIYPCHRYGDMENYIIGNVWEGDLDHERTMTYYRSLNRNSIKRCEACWVRHICGGPCPWEVSHPDGSIYEPEEHRCGRIRSGVEKTLSLRHRMENEYPELASLNDNRRSGTVSLQGVENE